MSSFVTREEFEQRMAEMEERLRSKPASMVDLEVRIEAFEQASKAAAIEAMKKFDVRFPARFQHMKRYGR